ncbi:28S ribosomal protein S33, mitochondrial [Ischnura elegans]|uniref:28S ribosomal protein S33, mitochondrial n=1 Tax=Ischnura elegans TaxID=197161 RepID=UPI001ED8995B|nr:28S ribosomal protein S33, mitochondrial [Ischnura elegans]
MASLPIGYTVLTKLTTSYSTRMSRLRNRIFGEVVRPATPRTNKVITMLSAKPMNLRPEVVEYYPRHVESYLLMMKLREYGLFRDEHQDFKEEMKRLRTLRGKGPTKKGEGKRASRK